MSPALLGAALVACVGAGLADLAVLNVAVVPALVSSASKSEPSSRQRARLASAPLTLLPAAHVVTMPDPAPEAVSVSSSTSDEPAQSSALLVILEFESSSHHVDARARWALRLNLKALRNAAVVRVVGHADASGPDELNDRISGERATAVVQKLIEGGVEAARIQSEARGERELRPDGNSRRVEVYVGGQS